MMMAPTINFTGNVPLKAEGRTGLVLEAGGAAFAKLMSCLPDDTVAEPDQIAVELVAIAEVAPEAEQVEEAVAEESDTLPMILPLPVPEPLPQAGLADRAAVVVDELPVIKATSGPMAKVADISCISEASVVPPSFGGPPDNASLIEEAVSREDPLSLTGGDRGAVAKPERINPSPEALFVGSTRPRMEARVDVAPPAAEVREPDQPKESPMMTTEISMRIGVEAKADLSAAHAPAPKSVPQLAQNVVRQISSHVADQQGNLIEVTLTPEELGTVRLVISAGERPAVAVYADNPATLDLMRRHADLLARELRDTGLTGADLSFGDNSGNGRGHAADRTEAGFSGERVTPLTEPQVQTPRPCPVLGSLIDIRI